MRNADKKYLGDGVYAHFNEYDLVLTTSDGIENTNTIYLESEVIRNLIAYIDEVKKWYAAGVIKGHQLEE